jgi:hypothetical protein
MPLAYVFDCPKNLLYDYKYPLTAPTATDTKLQELTNPLNCGVRSSKVKSLRCTLRHHETGDLTST